MKNSRLFVVWALEKINLPRTRSAPQLPYLWQWVHANSKNMKERLSFIPWVLEKRVFALSFTAFHSRLLCVVLACEQALRGTGASTPAPVPRRACSQASVDWIPSSCHRPRVMRIWCFPRGTCHFESRTTRAFGPLTKFSNEIQLRGHSHS